MPCLLLQPYVRCFTYRELDSSDNKIRRPLFATHEFMISFNLSEKKFGYIKPVDDNSIFQEQRMRSEIVLTGIGSQFAGMMTSEGKARIFSIYFNPTGFYRIFGVPAVHFTDRIEEDEYTCRKDLEGLHQQLREAKHISGMIACCEEYLTRLLSRSKAKDAYNSILFLSERIVRNGSSQSIEKLAYDANMSMKTFERRFTEQVGVSPKLFSRIVRFNRAIALKMNDHKKNWTTIAHHCGYFDQMHFIKDFKLFSGTPPDVFFKNTPPVSENFLNPDDI
ncbi:helix-turn-helix domain-containing protein [Terrimonas alba]|uniref:helix-turn-helix domain-containing protein n=1 Tax=Terrimonas alba TaxID=3349636 RepID=UPI0035F46B2B